MGASRRLSHSSSSRLERARHKRMRTVGVASLGAVLLAACGSSGSSATASQKTATSKPASLVLLKHFNSFESTYDRRLATGFESTHKNVSVQVETPQTGAVFTKLQTMLAGGSPPNVYLAAFTYFPVLLASNALAPIPYSAFGVKSLKALEAEYLPGTVQDYVRNGKLYGIPEEDSNYQAYMNSSEFSAAGLKTPTTWAQVCADGPKMLKTSGGAVVQEELALPVNFPPALVLVADAIAREFGSPLFNTAGTKAYLNNPHVIAAFSMLQRLVYQCHAFDPALNGTTTASERILYGEGKSAMVLDVGSWYTPGLQQSYKNVFASSVVRPYPTNPGVPSQNDTYGYAYVVPKAASHKATTFEYLHFLQQQGAYAFKLGLFSGLKTVASTSAANAVPFWKSEWVPSLAAGHYAPLLSNSSQIDTIISNAYDSIVESNANVASTLKGAETAVQPLLNK